MKIIFTLFLFLFNLSSSGQGTFNYQKDFKEILAKTKDSTGSLSYGKLLTRFIANDTTLTRYQTLALMIGFTDQPDYNPYDDLDTEKEIFVMNDEGNYEDALQEANVYLATHPVSLRVLKEKSYSLHQLKKSDSAEYYMDLVHKIMLAMLFSGNGKTIETPMFALGLADGERFTENAGMAISNKGTGESKSGLYLQLIDAVKDEGDHINLFFVIQHARNKITGEVIIGDKTKKSSKKSRKKEKKEKETNMPIPETKENQ